MQQHDFRISRFIREKLNLTAPVFITQFDLQKIYNEANEIAFRYNELVKREGDSEEYVSAGKLHTVAVLHLLYQSVLTTYLKENNPDLFSRITPLVLNDETMGEVVRYYRTNFPSPLLESVNPDRIYETEEDLRGFFIHQIMLQNPALVKASKPFVQPEGITFPQGFKGLQSLLGSYSKGRKITGFDEDDIFEFLTRPGRLFPNSLSDQLRFILREWSFILPEDIKLLLQSGLDFIAQEEKDHGTFNGGGGPAPVMEVPDYSGLSNEYEAFSADTNWMPRVVMIAKCTLVWLDQLSKWYHREIKTLDQIPDHELDLLAERGFTALWLIGLWERSSASKEIKILCGNPDADASAYSLKDYEIAASIGGWPALENLRKRCQQRGIRLASDMVPNHTGLDSNWMYEHPEYFVSQDYSPFPSYTFNGPDLSTNPDIEIKLEDHYFSRTDAAVTFRRRDKRTGETKYVFHGNDGTSMPWNDTAQLDYLNPTTREAVIQKILHVARNFPIIRFDAAMTLAKRHIQRLWYPKPGTGGDIAGRFVYAMSDEEFNRRIPQEFWREVVDRIAKEVPDTLLLAEAFWMLEGYFVRTLGMHRVYNSAFMNMLKNQENQKYRLAIKNTLAYEPEILKRYVNFMNNPDEETAIAQFGDGNRYFSICTILSTLPGLPMFGHGQIEGFREKYGMEYKRAYWNETPNEWIISEHYRKIFPLLRKRYLFSGVEHFNIYDAYGMSGVEESIFAYVNGDREERNLVIVNNQYERVSANIKVSAPKLRKGDDRHTECISLADNLGLTFSGRRYVIYENFSDGLTYITPSMKFFEEGYSFTIDGYDSLVLWNIREVEDTDGSYENLCNFLNGSGVPNINIAVALLRLKPLFRLLENFRGQFFFKSLSQIIFANSTVHNEKTLLLTIAETYTHLVGESETFDEALRAQLYQMPVEISPETMIRQIGNLSKAMKAPRGRKAFAAYARIAPELPVIIAVAITLKPFIDEETCNAKASLTACDRILMNYFFDERRNALKLNEQDFHQVIHFGALFSILGHIMFRAEDRTAVGMLREILKDSEIRACVKCNEYQGVTWYNKELMQTLIVLSALSYVTVNGVKGKFSADEYIDELLEKEALAEYKLDNLLGQ